MKEIHSTERQQFQKLFQQENIDRFEDRFKVLEVFLTIEKHVTASELEKILKGHNVSLPIYFVEETLELMCNFGFAQRNRFENGDVRYEHRHLGQHHDHLICTKCGQITEFQNERIEQLQTRIASEKGFHMLQHRMEIYGICGQCLQSREKLIPLTSAKPGERLVIKDFIGGAEHKLRLLSMGLRVGDELEVITSQGQGRIVVAADYQRFVLGRGMAEKIMVVDVPSG